jgi:hypothetical protein
VKVISAAGTNPVGDGSTIVSSVSFCELRLIRYVALSICYKHPGQSVERRWHFRRVDSYSQVTHPCGGRSGGTERRFVNNGKERERKGGGKGKSKGGGEFATLFFQMSAHVC